MLQNPDRIEALQGSHLRLRADGGDDWRIRFGSRASERPRRARSHVELPSRERLPRDRTECGDATEVRRLLPVTVTPDRAPTIRIEAPGKDLLLPNAKPTIAVAASATDDFGLRSLELRYTRVSGSGEQFEFQEGTLPLAIAHETRVRGRAEARSR